MGTNFVMVMCHDLLLMVWIKYDLTIVIVKYLTFIYIPTRVVAYHNHMKQNQVLQLTEIER